MNLVQKKAENCIVSVAYVKFIDLNPPIAWFSNARYFSVNGLDVSSIRNHPCRVNGSGLLIETYLMMVYVQSGAMS